MGMNEASWSRGNVERLMNYSAMLAELTGTIEGYAEVPAKLSSILEIEPVTLAILEQTPGKLEPTFLCLSASGKMGKDGVSGVCQKHVQEIFQQTCQSAAIDNTGMRQTFNLSEKGLRFAQTACGEGMYPRQLVLMRDVSATTRLMLVLHLRGDQMLPSGLIMESLALIVNQMAKLLQTTLSWMASPETLGEDFRQLTAREWGVLLGLRSEDGEKQLADKLGLSPHTLHSHIKAIYRKMNVQGRLSLLLKLNASIKVLRLKSMYTAPVPQGDNCDRAAS